MWKKFLTTFKVNCNRFFKSTLFTKTQVLSFLISFLVLWRRTSNFFLTLKFIALIRDLITLRKFQENKRKAFKTVSCGKKENHYNGKTFLFSSIVFCYHSTFLRYQIISKLSRSNSRLKHRSKGGREEKTSQAIKNCCACGCKMEKQNKNQASSFIDWVNEFFHAYFSIDWQKL